MGPQVRTGHVSMHVHVDVTALHGTARHGTALHGTAQVLPHAPLSLKP